MGLSLLLGAHLVIAGGLPLGVALKRTVEARAGAEEAWAPRPAPRSWHRRAARHQEQRPAAHLRNSAKPPSP